MFLGEKGRKFLFTKLDAFWVFLHILFNLQCTMRASHVVLVVKNLLAHAGDARDVSSILESESSPGGGHVTHSGILFWRIPWAGEPGMLQSIGLQGIGHD